MKTSRSTSRSGNDSGGEAHGSRVESLGIPAGHSVEEDGLVGLQVIEVREGHQGVVLGLVHVGEEVLERVRPVGLGVSIDGARAALDRLLVLHIQNVRSVASDVVRVEGNIKGAVVVVLDLVVLRKRDNDEVCKATNSKSIARTLILLPLLSVMWTLRSSGLRLTTSSWSLTGSFTLQWRAESPMSLAEGSGVTSIVRGEPSTGTPSSRTSTLRGPTSLPRLIIKANRTSQGGKSRRSLPRLELHVKDGLVAILFACIAHAVGEALAHLVDELQFDMSHTTRSPEKG